MATPTSFSRDDTGALLSEWSDGSSRRVTPRILRESCPCAVCKEKRSAPDVAGAAAAMLPVLRAEETQPLQILSMRPVGNYAYGVAFSDGHHSGLYSLEMIYEISSPVGP